MKKQKTDTVLNEVRRARAEVARERVKDPTKFQAKTRQIMKEHGMKTSGLKPMKIPLFKRLKKMADAA